MSEDPFKGFRITSDPDLTSIEQPGKDPARELPQLPLRLVLVSDLTPQAVEVDWSGPSRLTQVDKNSFAGLMQEWAPRLTLDVPNRIASTPKLLDVTLQFDSLDAFHPEGVARQVPALAQLLQIRTLVAQVQGGDITMETFRDRLAGAGVDADWAEQLYQTLTAPPEASTRPAGSSGDATLDRLLGMVDFGGNGSATQAETPSSDPGNGDAGSSALDALMSAITEDEEEAGPKVKKSAAGQLIGDLDELIGEQLNAILGHTDFRRLEAAWRGLRFMVGRLPLRSNIELDVLPASKEDVNAALYHQVLLPEHHGTSGRPPLSAVILDHAFTQSAADVEQLDDLAETGASLQAPLIASAAPGFFGVAQYRGMAKLPPLWQHFEQPEYIAWNKLREKKEARFLALALPAFLLRAPYGDDAPVKAFTFAERGGVWGNASLAVAVRIGESFAETGWPTHLIGERNEIGDLPLAKAAQGHTPLAVLLPDSRMSEFVRAGFVALGGKVNTDSLYVARAQTACRPEAYEDLMAATEAKQHVTLACQLFVARAAHYALVLQDELEAGEDIEALVQEATKRIRAFFHTEGHTVPPDAVSVEHVTEMDLPKHELLAVRMKTPSYILPRPVSLVVGMQVRKATPSA